MSPLNLYLLGPPRIECDGELIQVDTRKAIALLAYVALTHERHRRDALVNFLWPEYDQIHGRAALRRTLSVLRKALPDEWLDIEREDVGLDPAADVRLDVDQFHAHLAECRTHGHPTSEPCHDCLAHLSAAVTLYRGDFMSGFGLKDSFNFDDWQFFQGEALHRELAGALEKLAQGHSASGDLETAIGYARQWLGTDRLNETAHAQLMLLYAWSGRRSAALRQYQECVRILESDLGVAPQKATTALYRAIVQGRAPQPLAGLTPLQPEEPVGATSPARTDISGPLDRTKPTTEAPLASPEGEKRFVTVLFADASGSYALGEEASPEGEASLAGRLSRVMGEVLARYSGRVEQSFGTGVLGILGATHIHEGDPELAIRAAIEVQREARRLGMNVRAGISTGGVVLRGATPADGHLLGQQQVTPVGTVVELAARLANRAQAGQILVAESTYRLSRRAFEFTPLTLEAAATGEPVVAYRVERLLLQPKKARGIEGLRAALIGRDWELTRLKEAFAQIQGGEGQVVALIGEAGVGKSRLVAELREAALSASEDQPAPLWLEGRCLELGTPTSYAPFIDMLHEYLAWRPEEGERRRRESIVYALRRMVERGDLAEERAREIGPVLGRLLSVRWGDEWDTQLEEENPEQIRNHTFLALYDFFVALALQRPVALVCEDVHWADTLSLDLIALLIEALPGRPLLLMCVYRPEREHRCQRLTTVAARRCGDRYTELHLRELTREQSWQMVESLLATEALPSSVRELVLAHSQGNPFFIEEIVRSLIDAGIVYPEGDAWHARDEIGALPLPASVQCVILSRIDRLGDEPKHVLQVASVIGRVFRRRVLAHTLHREEDLESILWELEERALVYRERAIPVVEYSFKHVLTQETVYGSIARDRRAGLHQRVASAIESLYGDNLDDHYEPLAHHHERAGNLEQAVGYLLQAGEKAKRGYDNEAAIAHLNRGLQLLRALPDTPQHAQRELELLMALGTPLVHTKGHAAPKVETTYARARELCRGEGDAPQRFLVLSGLRRFYAMRGELGTAHELGDQLLTLAQRSRDTAQRLWAHLFQGETSYWLGEFAGAREHLASATALHDPEQHRSHVFLYGNDPKVGSGVILALALWHLGYPSQALRMTSEMLARAEALSHPFPLVMAFHFAAMLHQFRREAQATRELEEACLRIARERGYALFAAWGTIWQGWALGERPTLHADDQPDTGEGLNLIRKGIAAWREIGAGMSLPSSLGLLAEACGEAGMIEEGLSLLAEALTLVEEKGERCWEAELYRLKGKLLLMKGDPEAEACFRRAIEIARRQQARSWELRAATSLARLWQVQGRRPEARELLGNIYGWFTEGFDTADLLEARVLLDSLR